MTARTSAFIPVWILVITGLIGVHSRTQTDNFTTTFGTKRDDGLVLAYAPFVTEADRLFEPKAHGIDRVRSIALAVNWDRAVRRGVLCTFHPVGADDVIEDGERGRILLAKERITSFLLQDAKNEQEAGNTKAALEETLVAMRLTESLKYCDLQTAAGADVEEGRQLAFLATISRRIGREEQSDIALQAFALSEHGPKLDALASVTEEQVEVEILASGQTARDASTAVATIKHIASSGPRKTKRAAYEALPGSPDSFQFGLSLRRVRLAEAKLDRLAGRLSTKLAVEPAAQSTS